MGLGGVKPPWECHTGAELWFYLWRFLSHCSSCLGAHPLLQQLLGTCATHLSGSFYLLCAKMAELLHQPLSWVFSLVFSHSCQASMYL